jgi:hypothetical protein
MEYVVVERARLARYRRALRAFDLRLVVLNPDPAVVLARDRARPEKTVAHHFVHPGGINRPPKGGGGPRTPDAERRTPGTGRRSGW